jgi:hypothetical protein
MTGFRHRHDNGLTHSRQAFFMALWEIYDVQTTLPTHDSLAYH